MSDWSLEEQVLGDTLEEVRTWNSMELTIRYEKSEVQDEIDVITESSDKSSLKELTFGGFRTVDTGDGTNMLELNAPSHKSDVRSVNKWFVEDYSIEMVGRDGEVFDIELDLLPAIEKDIEGEFGTLDEFDPPSDSQESDKFYFDFEFGSLSIRRVSVDTTETSDGTTDVNEITLVCLPDEVRLIEENFAKQNAVYVRNVPDGVDVVRDESDGGRQTVFISPPDGRDKPIPEDEYIVRSWETVWNGSSYTVTLELAKP